MTLGNGPQASRFLATSAPASLTGQAPPARPRQRATLATACGAHVVHDGLSDSLYVLLPLWAESFGLSHAQVGFIKTTFSSTMAAGQMPLGLLGERFGVRVLLGLGTIAAGAAFAGAATAGGYTGLLVWVLLAAVGCGVQHPLASALVSGCYPAGPRRSALGVYNFAGDIGKIIVPFLIATAAVLVGWRSGMVLYGVVMAVTGIAVYASLSRLGAGGRDASHGPPGRQAEGWGFTNARGYGSLAAIHVVDSASRTGFLTFSPFLLIEKGSTTSTVGFALALLFAGGAFGKLVCGLIAGRIGVMRTVVVTEIATVALMIGFVHLPLFEALLLLPILGAALNGTSSVLYGTVGEFVRPGRQERAFGLFYTLGSAASAVSPLLFGLLGDWTSVSAALIGIAGLTAVALPLCLPLARHLAREAPAGAH